jgi:hypothetical protein
MGIFHRQIVEKDAVSMAFWFTLMPLLPAKVQGGTQIWEIRFTCGVKMMSLGRVRG